MKTQNEILTDIYKIVKTTPINDLNGGIYKNRRPTDSPLEDTVISLISGISGKFLKDGALSVKIFYPDINSNNSYFEDTEEGQVLETLLFNLSTTLLNTEGYSFEISTRETYTEAVTNEDKKEELWQHYTILKMNFKITKNEY